MLFSFSGPDCVHYCLLVARMCGRYVCCLLRIVSGRNLVNLWFLRKHPPSLMVSLVDESITRMVETVGRWDCSVLDWQRRKFGVRRRSHLRQFIYGPLSFCESPLMPGSTTSRSIVDTAKRRSVLLVNTRRALKRKSRV